MVQKFFLLLRTIRHLRVRQIFYQLYYRVSPVKSLAQGMSKEISISFLQFSNHYGHKQHYEKANTFIFLNMARHFPNGINWNFQEYGKLWNYNLQYFDYLTQENIPCSIKQGWLSDIGNWLFDGRLKPEPYPVSLRVINTIKYLSVNRITNESISKSVYAQLAYLFKHPEYHISGNHLLENGFALFMGGHFFHNVKWQKKAKKILARELEEQVLDDGGHFELSPMYHQVILFRLLELADWYSKVEEKDPAFLDFVSEKARKMLGWLQSITFKNGDIPHFNDSADNSQYSSTLLFQLGRNLNIAPVDPSVLKDSGYRKYVLDDYECSVDVAEPGSSYQPGHSHADALSFVIYKSGKPFLTEAGTSTYEQNERREYERSTAAHNTVVLNGQNQSEVWGGFRLGNRASVKILKDSFFQLEAQHDGYRKFGVYHSRKFDFSFGKIEITDHIGNSHGQLMLHFHPDCDVRLAEGKELSIHGIASVQFDNMIHLSLKEYEFSEGFNKYRKAVKAEVDFDKTIITRIIFLGN